MNCLKKNPEYFSLNLGKLHNGANGQNPEVKYLQLYDGSDISAFKIDKTVFQEFVIDCNALTDTVLLSKVFDKIYDSLKTNFTVRTLLVNDSRHNHTLNKFLDNIRIIESKYLSVLEPFPNSCKSLKEILSVKAEHYYIYRNPVREILLPFTLIKKVQTEQYDICYYKDGSFIYSLYRDRCSAL